MNKNKFLHIIFSICTMFIVICIFYYTKWGFVRFYPVLVNFSLFLLFFVSSFKKETVIQKFAKLVEPDIKPKALDYTRKLTYIWAGFTFLNTFRLRRFLCLKRFGHYITVVFHICLSGAFLR